MVMHIMEHLVRRPSKILIIWLALIGWTCGQSDDLYYHKMTIPERYIDASDKSLQLDSLGKLQLGDEIYSGFIVSKFQNGNLSSKIPYSDGLMEGYHIKYYEFGDTAILRYYLKGEKHGEHLAWYESGQLKFQYLFNKGLSVGNHKTWYINGNLSQDMNYVEGMELGAQKMYRSDGKLRSNYVVRENGRKYGLVGLKRCAKIDSESGAFDPYKSTE
jgi:antitoxin component YwqK of YwqJK toxin-antitoxin module